MCVHGTGGRASLNAMILVFAHRLRYSETRPGRGAGMVFMVCVSSLGRTILFNCLGSAESLQKEV